MSWQPKSAADRSGTLESGEDDNNSPAAKQVKLTDQSGREFWVAEDELTNWHGDQTGTLPYNPPPHGPAYAWGHHMVDKMPTPWVNSRPPASSRFSPLAVPFHQDKVPQPFTTLAGSFQEAGGARIE